MSEHWAEEGGGRRARGFRVVLLNRVLAHYGLSLSDWAGSVYTLCDAKGRAAVVTDLGSLWSEAEKLVGRPLDPLDPALVAAIGASGTDFSLSPIPS
ncbi:MAG TPA: hypothetical protein VHS03_05015 [Gaiellaceae bacterium]|nr:hypothetical protein [Gaiellaceae bacterium]